MKPNEIKERQIVTIKSIAATESSYSFKSRLTLLNYVSVGTNSLTRTHRLDSEDNCDDYIHEIGIQLPSFTHSSSSYPFLVSIFDSVRTLIFKITYTNFPPTCTVSYKPKISHFRPSISLYMYSLPQAQLSTRM